MVKWCSESEAAHNRVEITCFCRSGLLSVHQRHRQKMNSETQSWIHWRTNSQFWVCLFSLLEPCCCCCCCCSVKPETSARDLYTIKVLEFDKDSRKQIENIYQLIWVGLGLWSTEYPNHTIVNYTFYYLLWIFIVIF